MRFFDRVKTAMNSASWDNMMRDWLTGNGPSSAGSIDVSGNNSLQYPTVFSCLRVLAETFASVPIKEYRRFNDGDREETNATGLYDILHNVYNEEMSAYAAREMAMYQINLGGNVVMERIRNRFGDVVGLYPYEWQRVKIERSEMTRKLRYTVCDIDKLQRANTNDKVLSRADVLHVAGPSLNGITGMSPLEYAAQAIRLGMTYETFLTKFYENGAFPSGVLKHPSHMSPEAFKRFQEHFNDNFRKLSATGKPLILEDGMEYVHLTMKMVDAELLASRKLSNEDVCRIYRVPMHLAGNLDKATNNNIEHQSLEFVMYTMLPWFKRWEDAINSQMLTREQRDGGYYFEHNMAALLRGDQKSIAEAFAIGRQWGWLTVNDIRRLLNMNRVDNGNILLQPLNMVEAGTHAVEEQKKQIAEDVCKLIEQRGL